jgi:hypothetical protein
MAARRPRAARRSRLVVLGLSAATLVGLVAGMAATARSQAGTPPTRVPTVGSPVTTLANEPETAEPAGSPFAGQRSITQTGAS